MMIFLFIESGNIFSKANAVGLFFGSLLTAGWQSRRIYWQTTIYGGHDAKGAAVRFQGHQINGAMI